MLYKRLLIIFCFLLLQGCGSKFYVNVDSLCTPDAATKKHYVLLSGDKNINIDDLQFQEYASYIHNALALKGFTRVTEDSEADIAILLRYYISEPKEEEYTYSTPVYKTVYYYDLHGEKATPYPIKQLDGYETNVAHYTTYTKSFILEAVDFKTYFKAHTNKQIWTTTVWSSGSNSDLRQIFPRLVAAGMKYFGEKTPHTVEVEMDESDSRIQEINGSSEK
ncbi:DUF4136 domain-containing protein [Halodesulfovibrio sp.]|uniref:DUF4136 domain-containing protein n=1 Tax=Halodesulfovibrio sp. TaxID=1912772 RepID=UPI0025C14D24|nr:DUF4136 domain-containing protein [Halodesulfovibrio sp.]